ncbi:MAG TPA: nucleoside recognition domain-containing protein [Thermoanaerobaculia bacterium]|nr:nucleoside recognition domain-containing protein [Thermoanaerobaculia bacterium]
MIRLILETISLWAVPVLLVGIPLIGMIRGVKVYDTFIDGAKEGFQVAVRIIPFLVGILVAIGMFRGSGAMDMLTNALRPLMAATGFPAELFPLAILRTLSGSGSLALTTDLIKRFGPDSVLGRTAATMYGSSETLFYVLAVYYGAVGVKRTRHTIPAALIGDVVAAVVAVSICAWLF